MLKFGKPTAFWLPLLITYFCSVGHVLGESRPPLPEALTAMQSDKAVTVKTVKVPIWGEKENYFYAFEPALKSPTVGFIIYPGAIVDPRAYAPAAHSIAAEGYLTVIVKMPDDLAVKGLKRANDVMQDYPGIGKWVIGGHSVGGSMACAYAKKFTKKVDGVVLWASWPSERFRLDDTGLKVISIYGTNDGHPDEIAAASEHLPADTQFIKIEGGNHAQCGWYRNSMDVNNNDKPATINREEQQTIMIQTTLKFFELFKIDMNMSLAGQFILWIKKTFGIQP